MTDHIADASKMVPLPASFRCMTVGVACPYCEVMLEDMQLTETDLGTWVPADGADRFPLCESCNQQMEIPEIALVSQ